MRKLRGPNRTVRQLDSHHSHWTLSQSPPGLGAEFLFKFFDVICIFILVHGLDKIVLFRVCCCKEGGLACLAIAQSHLCRVLTVRHGRFLVVFIELDNVLDWFDMPIIKYLDKPGYANMLKLPIWITVSAGSLPHTPVALTGEVNTVWQCRHIREHDGILHRASFALNPWSSAIKVLDLLRK